MTSMVHPKEYDPLDEYDCGAAAEEVSSQQDKTLVQRSRRRDVAGKTRRSRRDRTSDLGSGSARAADYPPQWESYIGFDDRHQLRIDMAGWGLGDSGIIEWCLWFRRYFPTLIDQYYGNSPQTYVASEVNFSENEITAVGMSCLLRCLQASKIVVLGLKLHSNCIEHAGELCNFLFWCQGALKELQVAHNQLNTKSVCDIMLAAAAVTDSSGLHCYPQRFHQGFQQGWTGAAPLWLRIEKNFVDYKELTRCAEYAFAELDRPGRLFCGINGRRCTPRCCMRHKELPVLHVKMQGSQRSANDDAATEEPDHIEMEHEETVSAEAEPPEEQPQLPRELLLSVRHWVAKTCSWQSSEGDHHSASIETASGDARSLTESAASTQEMINEAGSMTEHQPSELSDDPSARVEPSPVEDHSQEPIAPAVSSSKVVRADDDDEVDLDTGLVKCAARRPAVGDRVQRLCGIQQEAKSRDGREGAWILHPFEIATVVEVDADGDVRLKNSKGLESAFVFRKFFVFTSPPIDEESHLSGRPPGKFKQGDKVVQNDDSASGSHSEKREFVFNAEAVAFVPQAQSTTRAALNAKAPAFMPVFSSAVSPTSPPSWSCEDEAPTSNTVCLVRSTSSGYEDYPFSTDAEPSRPSRNARCKKLGRRQLANSGRARLQIDGSEQDSFGDDGFVRGYCTEDENSEDDHQDDLPPSLLARVKVVPSSIIQFLNFETLSQQQCFLSLLMLSISGGAAIALARGRPRR